MDILVKREIAKRMLSPSEVEFTPVVTLNHVFGVLEFCFWKVFQGLIVITEIS